MNDISEGFRLLWADDQQEFVRSTAVLIEDLSSDLAWCKDGDAALNVLRSDEFDLVLLDLRMPPGEWGGLHVLETGRMLLADTPVIVLSGAGTVRECMRAVRLGAVDYVEKERVDPELRQRVVKAMAEWPDRLAASDYDRISSLERRLHETIIGVLADEAQQRGGNLFQMFVPKKVALKTYERLIDSGCGVQEDYLDLLDLGVLLEANWSDFRKFEVLGTLLPSRSRKDRTAWLQSLNEMRKVVAHPVRGRLERTHRRRLFEIEELVEQWHRLLRTPHAPTEALE